MTQPLRIFTSSVLFSDIIVLKSTVYLWLLNSRNHVKGTTTPDRDFISAFSLALFSLCGLLSLSTFLKSPPLIVKRWLSKY
ncbi:hypothetical protein BGZ57DRAFT_555987 [Hyaloscypha finlandica]|nr:hypothetical protein BGZ57DRAFT_555987 [Hyaloscypha finlandica]